MSACLACGHADRHADWCGPDYLAQDHIAIGQVTSLDAEPIPDRILAKPAIGAYRDPDLQAAKAWTRATPGPVSVLTSTDREWLHGRIGELADERQARGEAHADKLERTAAHLGREVAAHRVLLADAEARLERLVWETHPDDLARMPMVPYDEAREITRRAFADAYRRTHG